jgi:hypothetical protein
MRTIEVFVVLGDDGKCEVATDETIAIERWTSEFEEGTCRIVRVNLTMSDPHYPDDDDDSATNKAVEVMIPDDAGRIVDVAAD